MPFVNAYMNLLAQATVGNSITPFNNANAHIGVGDGTTAFSASQTDLQGTNKLRKGMGTGYPQVSSNQMTFRSTFGTSEANFAWNEVGIFNASSGGTMMLRELPGNLGTKTSAHTWELTVTVTMSPYVP